MCVNVCNGCRCVKQAESDSDRSTGHVWAAVMDASVAVISKAFQGHHDRPLYVCVCVCLLTSVWVQICASAKGENSPRGTHKNQQVLSSIFFSYNLWIK